MTQPSLGKLFRMDDRMRGRHPRPGAVWVGLAPLPLVLLAGWSHVWIGPWGAGAAIAALALWAWVNPRLYGVRHRAASWRARAVFGERVWLNRAAVPIPSRHAVGARLALAAIGLGVVLGIGGTVLTLFWLALAGATLAMLGRIWFQSRMVRLYRDMKDRDPIYRFWLRLPANDNRRRSRAA